MSKMTYTEFLNRIEAILPEADIQDDGTGQLVIYTGMMRLDEAEGPEGSVVVPFDSEDSPASE